MCLNRLLSAFQTSGLSGEPAARIIAATVEIPVFPIPKHQSSSATGTAVVGHCTFIPYNGSLDILHVFFSLFLGILVGR